MGNAESNAPKKVMIEVSALDVEDQHNRLEEIQSTLMHLQTVMEELRYGEHREDFVRSITALASEAMNRACNTYAEDALVFSQSQRYAITEKAA